MSTSIPATPATGNKPRPARRMSAGRRAQILLILFSVLTTLIVGVSEIVIRIAAPQPASWLDFYRRHPELPFFSMRANEKRLVDTGETHWTAITDGNGHRIGSTPPAQDARPQLLALGDSFTFGHGLDYEKSYLGLIASGVEHSYRVINTAVGGYGPPQYADTLAYELKQGAQPSLIFVGTFLGNDFHDCVWDKDAPVNNGIVGDEGGLRSWIAKHSHLYRLVSKVVHILFAGPTAVSGTEDQLNRAEEWDGPFLNDALKKYQQSMARIAELAAQQRSQLLVAIIPTRSAIEWMRTSEDKRDHTIDAGIAAQKAIAILERLQIPYVDLTPSLIAQEPAELYFAYDGHFTELGSRIAADAILEHIASPGAAPSEAPTPSAAPSEAITP